MVASGTAIRCPPACTHNTTQRDGQSHELKTSWQPSGVWSNWVLLPPLAWLLEQRARADRSDDFDADLGEDVSVTDESMAAVRVMTVHKAKGLQGKYVIIYGWQTTLDKRTPEPPRWKEPLRLTDPKGDTVCGYQLDWGLLTIISPSYPQADALNQQLETEEAKRLGYVAATRAKDRLVLLSPHWTR